MQSVYVKVSQHENSHVTFITYEAYIHRKYGVRICVAVYLALFRGLSLKDWLHL